MMLDDNVLFYTASAMRQLLEVLIGMKESIEVKGIGKE
jgi:hypothetical protein